MCAQSYYITVMREPEDDDYNIFPSLSPSRPVTPSNSQSTHSNQAYGSSDPSIMPGNDQQVTDHQDRPVTLSND